MIHRKNLEYAGRIVNTEVRVYSTAGGEEEITSCGKITGE